MDKNDWKDLRPYIERILGPEAAKEIGNTIQECERAAEACEFTGQDGVFQRYGEFDVQVSYWQARALKKGGEIAQVTQYVNETVDYVEGALLDRLVSHCGCTPLKYQRKERPVAAGLVGPRWTS